MKRDKKTSKRRQIETEREESAGLILGTLNVGIMASKCRVLADMMGRRK